MPLCTDVNLPKWHKAVFPKRCVRCGSDPQDGTLRIWTQSIGWWSALWMFGSGFSVRVPACYSCGWRIRIKRVGGLLITIVVAMLFLAFVWPYVEGAVPRILRKWVALAMVLVCLAPVWIWEVIFPPPIDITAFPKTVDYEFRDADYAREFARLNAQSERMKVN